MGHGDSGHRCSCPRVCCLFRVSSSDGPFRQEAVQPGAPTGVPQTDREIRSTPPARPDQIIAKLDLRNASTTRTVQPSGSTSNLQPIEIPRGLLTLTVQLPIGSEPGSYQVEIRRANQPTISPVEAQATIDNGIPKLLVSITRSAHRVNINSPGDSQILAGGITRL